MLSIFQKIDRLPDITFCFNLKRRPLCLNLSKGLKYIWEYPDYLKILSKNLPISWVMDISWLVYESNSLKLNWFDEIVHFQYKVGTFGYIVIIQKFYNEWVRTVLAGNFLVFVYHLSYERNNICLITAYEGFLSCEY